MMKWRRKKIGEVTGKRKPTWVDRGKGDLEETVPLWIEKERHDTIYGYKRSEPTGKYRIFFRWDFVGYPQNVKHSFLEPQLKDRKMEITDSGVGLSATKYKAFEKSVPKEELENYLEILDSTDNGGLSASLKKEPHKLAVQIMLKEL